MNKKIMTWVIGTIVCIAIIAGVFLSRKPEKSSYAEVKLGAVLPMTGPTALIGQNQHRGLELAVAHLNKLSTKEHFKLVSEDSKGVAASGVSAALRLLDIEHANFIFTSLTPVSLAIAPLFKERSGIQVIFGMDESMANAGGNVFRIYPGIREEGVAITEIVRSVGPKKVAILTFEHPAIDSQVREVIEPALGRFAAESINEKFSKLDEKGLRNAVAKISFFSPDLIIINAYYNQIPFIMRTVADSGIPLDIPIVGGLNLAIAIKQDSLNQMPFSRIYIAMPGYLFPRPVQVGSREAFESEYISLYGNPPDHDAAYAYDAAIFLGKAIESVGNESVEVKKNIISGIGYEGVTGPLQIDANGNAQTKWVTVQFADGQYVLLPEEK